MDERTQDQFSTPLPPAPSNRGLVVAVIVLVCAAAVSLFYAFRERNDAQRLAESGAGEFDAEPDAQPDGRA